MADAWGRALLAAYGAAGRLLQPVLPLLLARRARRGKEDKSRLAERYGRASVARPPGRLVWVHAASVGETNTVMPLIRRLVGQGSGVLLTTVTVTGATVAARTLPAGAIHQFAPVDIRPYARRFLRHWRPDLAVFAESEVWPVTTDALARAGIPHVVVNGRMSEKAFRRWRRFGRAGRTVFARIALVLAQADADRDRFAALGAPNVPIVGNLKFDAPPPGCDEAALVGLRAELGNRPCFLAASTHPGEEAVIADMHRRIAPRFAGLVTIIVPRHPERGAEVAAAVAGDGTEVRRRSVTAGLPPGGVLVADTLGELGLFYRLAPVSYVGGSLVPRGGQNPIEPVRLRSAVIHGPLVANFAAVYATLDAAGGAVPVGDSDALAAAASRLLGDEPARLRQIVSAETAIAPFTGALDRTMAALVPLLAGGGRP